MARLTLSSNLEDRTLEIGRRLAGVLRSGDLVLLDGPLGAGKTSLVRGVALGLGIDPARVSSPTFVIAHEYTAANGVRLHHLDAYRLTGPDDLQGIGWDQIAGSGGIVLIEWGERVAAGLAVADGAPQPSAARVRIELTGASERRVTFTAPDVWTARPGWTELAMMSEVDDSDGAAPPTTLRCPGCRAEVRATLPTAPFCSERCRMSDLGRWFSGRYSISRELTESDADDPDLQPPATREGS